MPQQELLNIKQAQELLGLSERTIFKLLRSGELKGFKAGRAWRFEMSDIDAYIERQRRKAEEQARILRATQSETEFALATPDDAGGIYAVAASLFPQTTSSEDRASLIAACSEGNYIVKDRGEVVAYITLLVCKSEIEAKILAGQPIGHVFRPEDVSGFIPDKPLNVLVKSVGATRKYGELKAAHYMARLLRGLKRALEEMGSRGIHLHMLYGISESVTGIALCLHAGMRSVRRIVAREKEHKQGLHIFVLDVESSHLPLLQPYKSALATWQRRRATTESGARGEWWAKDIQPGEQTSAA